MEKNYCTFKDVIISYAFKPKSYNWWNMTAILYIITEISTCSIQTSKYFSNIIYNNIDRINIQCYPAVHITVALSHDNRFYEGIKNLFKPLLVLRRWLILMGTYHLPSDRTSASWQCDWLQSQNTLSDARSENKTSTWNISTSNKMYEVLIEIFGSPFA